VGEYQSSTHGPSKSERSGRHPRTAHPPNPQQIVGGRVVPVLEETSALPIMGRPAARPVEAVFRVLL